ncbi:MAG: DUF262 domain-containing protein [Holophagales bacterium]|nr:DUF262 domain-containing protein [Holophagales bacterium]MYC11422.1 DUF262 domain-containing protein [Holophagales bacterium]
MEKKFDADNYPLAQLLREAAEGRLQLPDFQRGWVWDDSHIKSLLASISLSYPIGAVMTLRTGNPDVRFRSRPLEGVRLDREVDPEVLLLDGQQRMTSLFFALVSKEPVETRDDRGRKLRRHYYVDIDAALNPSADREEQAIASVPEDRIERTDFGRRIVRDLGSLEKEVAEGMFPLDIVLDVGATKEWSRAYFAPDGSISQDRFDMWSRFDEAVVDAFTHYEVPTIELARSTAKEAVCRVFEKVNTGGVTLTVFELLTATLAAEDFNLREDWQGRLERLGRHRLLGGFPAERFLQIVTLLVTLDRRRRHLSEGGMDERAPAVSCQRRDILRLGLEEYERWADVAVDGLERAVSFLHEEYFFGKRDLPYPTQLVPLAAMLGHLGRSAESAAARERLRQWFWCGVLGELYGSAVETRSARDFQECLPWLVGDGDEPRTVQEAQFQADRLLSLRTRQSAAYRGLHALGMKKGARDWKSGVAMTVHSYFDHAVDIHHIFPRRWCNRPENAVGDQVRDCVVNKTALARLTNRFLGGDAPSKYVRRIETTDSLESERLNGFLRTHGIDAVALRRDDFAAFFNHRFEELLRWIEAAMGKPVNRSPDRDESPFFELDVASGVRELVALGESQNCEFKSTGRVNLFTGQPDPTIEWAVLRSIAGFLNADGGTLLVGVEDDGGVVGIEKDFPYVQHKNLDGWGLWLTSLVAEALGDVAPTALSVQYCTLDGADTTVARIDVEPSVERGVYTKPAGRFRDARKIKDLKHGENIFFVRRHAQTVVLSGRELDDYQRRHWDRF